MNTDRELLELAAKAAGYQIGHKWNRERLEMDPPIMAMVVHDMAGELVSTGWNPLDDDGHALRLAVKLRLDITFYNGFQEVAVEPSNGDGLNPSQEEFGDDPFSATRRAIVRAAAEIGRAM